MEALQTFIYNEQEHPAQTIFYFHGGAYINQPNAQQTTMAARAAKETGCEVVLMGYPKEPVYDCETAYEQCLSYYRSYLENKDCGKIVFMGDSAGGGLALGLAEVLRDEGGPCPAELILISPWVDVSMSNSKMDECERVEVERRFSLAKRKCGMGLVTAKLQETAAHVIAMSVLVLNLRKIQCALLQVLTALLDTWVLQRKLAFVQ